MHHYLLRVSMRNGQTLEGTALDTARNEMKVECIKLKQAQQEVLIVLDDIVLIEVLTANPHFQSKTFCG